MDEARRFSGPEEFDEHLQEIDSEGQGCWRLEMTCMAALAHALLTCTELPRDGPARSFIEIARLLSKGEPGACFICSARIQLMLTPPPGRIGVVHAERDDPQAAIGFLVCEACDGAMEYTALQQRIIDIIGENMLSDMRMLSPLPEAGHA